MSPTVVKEISLLHSFHSWPLTSLYAQSHIGRRQVCGVDKGLTASMNSRQKLNTESSLFFGCYESRKRMQFVSYLTLQRNQVSSEMWWFIVFVRQWLAVKLWVKIECRGISHFWLLSVSSASISTLATLLPSHLQVEHLPSACSKIEVGRGRMTPWRNLLWSVSSTLETCFKEWNLALCLTGWKVPMRFGEDLNIFWLHLWKRRNVTYMRISPSNKSHRLSIYFLPTPTFVIFLLPINTLPLSHTLIVFLSLTSFFSLPLKSSPSSLSHIYQAAIVIASSAPCFSAIPNLRPFAYLFQPRNTALPTHILVWYSSEKWDLLRRQRVKETLK